MRQINPMPLVLCLLACTPSEHSIPGESKESTSVPTVTTEAPSVPEDEHEHKSEQKKIIPDDMFAVPGGIFTMGRNDRGMQDERPAHDVSVKSFLLDKTEVTNDAYAECVNANKCKKPAWLDTQKSGFATLEQFRKGDHPVTGVSQSDALAFCSFKNKRLPTEAEWERAARGDDARTYPWGEQKPTSKLAVFRSKVTAKVGSRPDGAGPYGHLDLAGNVWEWLADNYDPYAYKRPTANKGIAGNCDEILAAQDELRKKGMHEYTGTNPIPTGCEHVLRGGAFNYFPWGLRTTNRVHHPGRFRIIMAGFRCAADL